MPDENSYRYEGSAESLAKPSERVHYVRQPSSKDLFIAGLLGAFLAAFLIPMFVSLFLIPFSLCLILLVLMPIGVFVWAYRRMKNRWAAFIIFWSLTIILAFSLGMIVFLENLTYFLIGFGSQIIAASIALFIMTETST